MKRKSLAIFWRMLALLILFQVHSISTRSSSLQLPVCISNTTSSILNDDQRQISDDWESLHWNYQSAESQEQQTEEIQFRGSYSFKREPIPRLDIFNKSLLSYLRSRVSNTVYYYTILSHVLELQSQGVEVIVSMISA